MVESQSVYPGSEARRGAWLACFDEPAYRQRIGTAVEEGIYTTTGAVAALVAASTVLARGGVGRGVGGVLFGTVLGTAVQSLAMLTRGPLTAREIAGAAVNAFTTSLGVGIGRGVAAGIAHLFKDHSLLFPAILRQVLANEAIGTVNTAIYAGLDPDQEFKLTPAKLLIWGGSGLIGGRAERLFAKQGLYKTELLFEAIREGGENIVEAKVETGEVSLETVIQSGFAGLTELGGTKGVQESSARAGRKILSFLKRLRHEQKGGLGDFEPLDSQAYIKGYWSSMGRRDSRMLPILSTELNELLTQHRGQLEDTLVIDCMRAIGIDPGAIPSLSGHMAQPQILGTEQIQELLAHVMTHYPEKFGDLLATISRQLGKHTLNTWQNIPNLNGYLARASQQDYYKPLSKLLADHPNEWIPVGLDPTHCLLAIDPVHHHISKKHLAFKRDFFGNLWIKDLGSRNGTYVNGVRISDQEIQLKADDEVTLGKMRQSLGFTFTPSRLQLLSLQFLPSEIAAALKAEPVIRADGEPVWVGSTVPQGGLHIDGPTVSPIHCKIWYDYDASYHFIRDLSSSGVFIDGQRIPHDQAVAFNPLTQFVHLGGNDGPEMTALLRDQIRSLRAPAASGSYSAAFRELYPRPKPLAQGDAGTCYWLAGQYGAQLRRDFPQQFEEIVQPVWGGWNVTFKDAPDKPVFVSDRELAAGGQTLQNGDRIRGVRGNPGDLVLEWANGKARKKRSNGGADLQNRESFVVARGGGSEEFIEAFYGVSPETIYWSTPSQQDSFAVPPKLLAALKAKQYDPERVIMLSTTPYGETLYSRVIQGQTKYFRDRKFKFIANHAFTVTKVFTKEHIYWVSVVNPQNTAITHDVRLDEFMALFNEISFADIPLL